MAVWSEIYCSEIVSEIRADSEFYAPKYEELKFTLKAQKNIDALGKLSNTVKKGIFDISPTRYKDSGIPLIRTFQIKTPIVNEDNLVFINETDHLREFCKTELLSGDIVFTKIGAGIGDVGILPKKYAKYNFSQNVAGSSIKREKINPYFLIAFLNSRYGRMQIHRYMMPSGQGKLELRDIKKIAIPRFSDVEIEIARMMELSESKSQLSQSLYTQAQQLLERELGLDKLVFDKPLSYEARLSEVVGNNRADADYYQTRYKQLRSNISGNRTGIQRLIDFAIVLKPNIDPSKSPSSEFKYVELADINPTLGIINNANTFLGKELPSRARRVVTKGDVIASSVVGSVDKAALVDETNDGCLASTGFFHFRPKKNIKSEFLLLLVRSRCVTMQLQQESTGGILSAVPDQRLRNVIIPNIDLSIQNKIAALVCQSHKNFNQSKQLLEQAKRRVEELIEQAVQK